MPDVNLQDLTPEEVASIQAAQAKGPGKDIFPLGPSSVSPVMESADFMRGGKPTPRVSTQVDPQFADVQGGSSTSAEKEAKYGEVPFKASDKLQEWPDEVATDVATGMTTTPLTPDAKLAAGDASPAASPLARGSFARGGTPNKPSGPEGDSIDAPVAIEDDTHKALVAAGVNPAIAAMLADAQKRQQQLADASKEQRGGRFAADELYAMRAGFGIRGADELHKSELATADQKMALAKDQQAAGDQALTHAESLRGFTKGLDMDDPASEISQQVAKITGVPGVPASLYPQIADKLKARATAKEKAAELNMKQTEETGRNTRNTEDNDTRLEVERMKLRAAQQKPGKQLTAQQQDQLADIRAGRAQIQRLMADLEKGDINGPVAGLEALASKFGIDTEAGKAKAESETAVRTVGRGIEGGRFSDADAEAYGRSVVPKYNDPKDLQRFKGHNLLRRLDDKERELLGVAGDSGVNTGNLRAQSSGPEQRRDSKGVLRERGSDGLWRPVTR